jgi:hypothetical protein
LPPYLVQADQVTHWYYGEFSGLQVLSSCDWDVTKGFVHRFLRAEAEFAELVPEEFRGDVPELLILVPPAHAKAIAKEMSQLMRTVSNSSQTISHLRVSEEDLSAMYFIVDSDSKPEAPATRRPGVVSQWLEKLADDRAPDCLKFTFSVEYINYRLTARRPAMLPCLVSGVTDTFEAAAETEQGMHSQPDSWLTMDDWRAVRFDSEAPRPLLPLEELLRGLPPSDKDSRYCRLWRSEAELFVRWALFGDSGNRAEAFWRFARESTQQPLTEHIFQSCFGMDYADCRDALSDYLSVAARNPANWSSPVPTTPILRFRTAKPEEVDWLKGEWNRLILTAVERDFPSLLPKYQQQALKVITQALDGGERSARLLASLGLLQVEMGDDSAAMRSLEEAVGAGANRPMVLVELARLRLAHYLGAKSESNPKITESEAAKVLSLVHDALRPPQRVRGAYSVAREVFQHLDRQPTPEETRMLDEGTSFYGK